MQSKQHTISLGSRVTPSSDALVQKTGNEAVILDAVGERYFGLNEVGARLWSLLLEDPSLTQAHQRLLREYDVEPAPLERDLIVLAAQLADAGLVRID